MPASALRTGVLRTGVLRAGVLRMKQVVNGLLSRLGYQVVRAENRTVPRQRRVRVVVATQRTRADFDTDTYLGQSLALIPPSLSPAATVYDSNSVGLPTLYNRALDAAGPDDILVLVHDDVWLHDWHIVARAREAVERFDVAGIAGAVDADLTQPSWFWSFDADLRSGQPQKGAQSGSVNHGAPSSVAVRVYGPVPLECSLVDGVLLVVDVERARTAGARFDERFAFHFYDIDFCRTAVARGLRVGTWPIAITHASKGAWDTETFRAQARRYLEKWATSDV